MSFLNTFIELSILDESEYHSSLLNNQNRLINEQNDLLNQQNESINSLIKHNQQQDWIRDYIYRIKKLCDILEKNPDNKSLNYYYSIYCLAKGIHDSGLTTSAISELKDKEYFDNCLNQIETLLYNFVQENKENISEYNNLIKNIEDYFYLSELKKYEQYRYRLFQINQAFSDYEKEHTIKYRSRIISASIFVAIWISIVAKNNLDNFQILKSMIGCSLGAIILGIIFIKIFTKQIKENGNSKISKQRYNELLNEKNKYEELLAYSESFYSYEKSIFPDFDFTEEKDKEFFSKINNAIENKEKEVLPSIISIYKSANSIRNNFYLVE